jgi:hypothetical protein
MREGFADNLTSTPGLCQGLTKLKLKLLDMKMVPGGFGEDGVILNRAWQLTSLLPPTSSDQSGTTTQQQQNDPLSSAIWKATAKLEELEELVVCSTIDSSLFWPLPITLPVLPPPSRPLVEPFWQNLQHLHVYFHDAAPTGELYFLPPKQSQDPTLVMDPRRPTYRPRTLQPATARLRYLNNGPFPTQTPTPTRTPPGYRHELVDDICFAAQFRGDEDLRTSGYIPEG